jgi:hypothetical protein
MAKNSLVFSVSADIRKFSTGMQNGKTIAFLEMKKFSRGLPRSCSRSPIYSAMSSKEHNKPLSI